MLGIINPETFRSGTYINRKFQLRDSLLTNITVYKTVKKMFMKYSAPYVLSSIRRKSLGLIIKSFFNSNFKKSRISYFSFCQNKNLT
jgi:hypothetical protein